MTQPAAPRVADFSPIAQPVRVYLCECGPIMAEGIDLDSLQAHVTFLPSVATVVRHKLLCSDEGRSCLAQDLAAHPGARAVIAGCSPREHGEDFRQTCAGAGLNPYLLAIANIREQCAWVTTDREQATAKAADLVAAAVQRVLLQEPLEDDEIDCSTAVLVIGAGVAGLTVARQLARAGRPVCLVERTPAIGGRVTVIGEVFPDIECASCMLEPVMDEVLHDAAIETLVSSEVVGVKGSFGNFVVEIHRAARRVDPEGCYGCRSCHESCPVEVRSEADLGLSTRKAIYIPYAGALPNVSTIDADACLRAQGRECTACAEACPFAAIDLDAADEVIERRVGAVVLATGAAPRLAAPERLPNRVITAMMLERLINSAGPTGGEIRLPGLAPPRSIALVYCADENGTAPSARCSAICCLAMAKYRHQLHEKLPGCDIYELLWDRCAGGKGFREFVHAVDESAPTERFRLTEAHRVQGFEDRGDTVCVRYVTGSRAAELDVDLAVIAPPLAGHETNGDLARLLRIATDADGFFVEEHRHLQPFRTLVEGVLVAGAAHGPKDVQTTVAHAAAAAGEALAAIVPGRKLVTSAATAEVDEERCGACRLCVAACPYQAAGFDDERRVARINALLCRACGTCAAGCPSGAIAARHFTDAQLRAEIGAFLAGPGTPPAGAPCVAVGDAQAATEVH